MISSGTSEMQKWSADSWDCQLLVIHHLVVQAYAVYFEFYVTIRGYGLHQLITLKSNLCTDGLVLAEMHTIQWITSCVTYYMFMHTVLPALLSLPTRNYYS